MTEEEIKGMIDNNDLKMEGKYLSLKVHEIKEKYINYYNTTSFFNY